MSTADRLAIINKVLESMGEVVRSDGGEVSLSRYDAERRRVVLSYRQGDNDDCTTCAIDADMLQQFVQESLRSHGLEEEQVEVEARA